MEEYVFVWQKSTEEWMPTCTLHTVKTGEPSIMVWGCMSNNGVGPLVLTEGSVTGKKYRDILQKHILLLVLNRHRRRLATILQDDNAPIHRANVVKVWKERNELKCLEWPAQRKLVDDFKETNKCKRSSSKDSEGTEGCCSRRVENNPS